MWCYKLPFSCDSDILRPVSIYHRTGAIDIHALITAGNSWEIVFDIAREMQLSTLVNLKADIALQGDAAGEPFSFGYDDSSSSALCEAVNLLLYVAAAAYSERTLREDRTLKPWHVKRSGNGFNVLRHKSVYILCVGTAWERQCQ